MVIIPLLYACLHHDRFLYPISPKGDFLSLLRNGINSVLCLKETYSKFIYDDLANTLSTRKLRRSMLYFLYKLLSEG